MSGDLARIDYLLAERRADCDCAPYRKPCSTCDAYHDGMLAVLDDELEQPAAVLRSVAAAALRYMDEGGEHPDDDGLHIGSASDAAALNAALDELEAAER